MQLKSARFSTFSQKKTVKKLSNSCLNVRCDKTRALSAKTCSKEGVVEPYVTQKTTNHENIVSK